MILGEKPRSESADTLFFFAVARHCTYNAKQSSIFRASTTNPSRARGSVGPFALPFMSLGMEPGIPRSMDGLMLASVQGALGLEKLPFPGSWGLRKELASAKLPGVECTSPWPPWRMFQRSSSSSRRISAFVWRRLRVEVGRMRHSRFIFLQRLHGSWGVLCCSTSQRIWHGAISARVSHYLRHSSPSADDILHMLYVLAASSC